MMTKFSTYYPAIGRTEAGHLNPLIFGDAVMHNTREWALYSTLLFIDWLYYMSIPPFDHFIEALCDLSDMVSDA